MRNSWREQPPSSCYPRKEYGYTNPGSAVSGAPLDTYTYTYGDDSWGDLLTAYNGVQWSYDQIGNLTNDGTWTYTWRNGRELASISNGSATWNYSYDANGMRTSRTNGSYTYRYVYNGGQLMQMKMGGHTLDLTYDAGGTPMTVTFDGTEYYYITNLQGDVMGIADSSGTMVVSYTYDAWGKLLSTTGSMTNTLGAVNPLRYRGYVYDYETGYYYLQSRYYDPKIGRFINADAFVTTGQNLIGNNMFAYCGNNPVCRKDINGKGWIWAVVVAAVALIVAAVDVAYSINNWAHTEYNKRLDLEGYIFDQSQGVPSLYKYGFAQSSHNGCAWIATYNALIMLGDYQEPTELISYYENHGALLWGIAGTYPTAVADYFRARGYGVNVNRKTAEFDQQARNCTANVLFYWHNEGAHNIAVYGDKYGFYGYNVWPGYNTRIYLGTSLVDFLQKNSFTDAMLTSIW